MPHAAAQKHGQHFFSRVKAAQGGQLAGRAAWPQHGKPAAASVDHNILEDAIFTHSLRVCSLASHAPAFLRSGRGSTTMSL